MQNKFPPRSKDGRTFSHLFKIRLSDLSHLNSFERRMLVQIFMELLQVLQKYEFRNPEHPYIQK